MPEPGVHLPLAPMLRGSVAAVFAVLTFAGLLGGPALFMDLIRVRYPAPQPLFWSYHP